VDSLAEIWPLFGLRIATKRLELRLPREDELPALARAGRVIAAPGGPQLQMRWMYGPSPGLEHDLLQWHWRALAHWKPGSWNLPLAVFADGKLIGRQDLFADDFARVRSVGTGSWLTRACQGQGYGTEARAAVLDLAFRHLGAREANSTYVDGNHASAGVSRKLGYVPNGQKAKWRDGEGLVTEYRVRLGRGTWLAREDHDEVTVTGAAECMDLFGAAGPGPACLAGSLRQVAAFLP